MKMDPVLKLLMHSSSGLPAISLGEYIYAADMF